MSHGRQVDYRRGCRCQACRDAETRGRKRRQAGLTGTVPTDPVRDLFARLADDGWTTMDIAHAAGLHVTTVYRVRAGHTSRMRRVIATRVLAVDYASRHPGARIDGEPTRRRLRALVAIGWSLVDLQAHTGIDRATLATLTASGGTTVRTARTVADVYESLSGTPGGSQRAVLRARRHGWPPPLAWDDIDDLTDTPHGYRKESA